jgi:hypothetical protein
LHGVNPEASNTDAALIFKKNKMSQSNNNLSMINLLLLLGISLPQVSAGFVVNIQCKVVVNLWEKLTKKEHTSGFCCSYKDKEQQSSGIPGVFCDSKGHVTKINWYNKGLSGSISDSIGTLVVLQKLQQL